MRCTDTEVYSKSTDPTRLATFETPSPSIAERAKYFGSTLSTPKSHQSSLKESTTSSKFLTPRSRISVTGPSSLHHSAAASRSLSRVVMERSSSSQRGDPEPLCPLNIVASRRILFSPGSKSRKKPMVKKEEKKTIPPVPSSFSPTSDKENSGHGKRSQRFIEISSLRLKEVAKSYSFSATTGVEVDAKKTQNLKVVDSESSKDPHNNKARATDTRIQWLHQGVAKANSFSESEERSEIQSSKPMVSEQRSQRLHQRVTTGADTFTEPDENTEIKHNKLSVFEQRTQLLQQRVAKSNSFTEPEDEPEISSTVPSIFERMRDKRALFEQRTQQLLQTDVVKTSRFSEPEEEPHIQPCKQSIFEQRSQWLHQRVAKANSFTEPDEEEVTATHSHNETPKNFVAARTGWFQKQVSMHGLLGDEKLSKKWGSVREVERKSNPLLDTPTFAPPRYSTSSAEQPGPLIEGKKMNKLLRKAKKTSAAKSKKSLVEERAQWLQNQVCRNELHRDVPEDDKEQRNHDGSDVDQPKSNIEIRLEALKRDMMMATQQQQLGVAPKRSLTELP